MFAQVGTAKSVTRMAVISELRCPNGLMALNRESSRVDLFFMDTGEKPRGKWGSTAVVVGLALALFMAVGPRDALASVALSASTTSAVLASDHPLGLRPTPKAEAADMLRRSPWRGSIGAVAIPASVDLTPFAPTPGDQGQINSCVSWSVGYDLMGYYSNASGHVGAPYAPMYLYSQVNGGVDQGSTFTDTFRILSTQGVDTRTDYRPQGDYNWQLKPTAAQKTNASFHRALNPVLLYAGPGQGTNARLALSTALAAGQPVVMGIAVYNNFFYLSGSKSVFTNADVSGQLLGYHAVTAFGYNASGVVIENSWGTGWGKSGFATLGWDFVQNGVTEAWTTAGFANPTVSLSPTAWASAGAPTSVTINSPAGIFGNTANAFTPLGWKLTVGGVVAPLIWRSPTQVSFNAPLGLAGQPIVSLTRSGVSSIITTPVNYVASITGLTITPRVDGTRLLNISGAGLLSNSQWSLVAPSGATSPLTTTLINNLATGGINRIWVSADGKSATAVVGSIDPNLSEVGSYGLSYAPVSGAAQLVWPSGGVPFLGPSVTSSLPSKLTSIAGGDIVISGDGLASFMSSSPAGIRLVSDLTGQSTDLTIKAKALRSVTATVPRGTASGSYHLVVWTRLGTATTANGSLTIS